MTHLRAASLLAIALLSSAAVATAQNPAASCANLASTKLEHAKVIGAAVAGPRDLAALKLNNADSTPPFCRVEIVDQATADSEIRTEVWLPLTGWNGRLRGVGNGGFAGTIYYGQMADVLRSGYATVGTDTGHTGGTPEFALGHPEKVADFGWRAIHEMTVEAKTLIRAFYGRPQQKSYFTSCSDGGREALMEAQRFPADYDGILAGAPAYNWTGLMSGAAEMTQWVQSSAANFLPAAKIPALAQAVNNACDALDGVKDGIVNDPRACRFDPATIQCKAGDADTCLLPSQVETVRRIYRGAVDDAGKKVLPGLLPGSEDGPEGWALWISGDRPGSNMPFFGQGFFANFVYAQPGWTAARFDFDRDYKAAVDRTAASLNATDTNLAPFADRGDRLLMYHGWNDPAIPATMSISYYEGVTRNIGQDRTASALRLYLVPGMQHCGFGPGATEFGQGTGPRGDAQHDIYTALEDWVEKGTAPATLTARKTEGKGADRKVIMTRPLCPYPQVARYDGKGDTNKSESFTCAAK